MAESKRISNKATSIEDIWGSVSTLKASELNPPPPRIVLTPRSAEACLRHGVNPETLRIRPLDSFVEKQLDPVIQRMRHEAYTQRRFEMMRLVRGERKKLINLEAREMQLGGAGSGGMTPGQIVAQQAKKNATFVELEEKNMQKMRKRQEKDLEQMLSFEMKMSEIQEERDRRTEEEKRREEARKRAKEKRGRELAEERRTRELKKKAMEDAEEERRLEVARSMFEREKALRMERERKERFAKIEARNREEERLRKQEEHRLGTQRILAEQQAQIKRKMDEMEVAERERQEVIARKREEEREHMLEQRAQVEQRISRNMKQAQKVEESRKETFFTKQAHHEKLRAQHLEMLDRERSLQQRQNTLQEQRREMVVAQARGEEEKRKDELLERFELEEHNVERVKQARQRVQVITTEKKSLRNMMKLENVERIKRIQEYRRLETLRKIHEGDHRTEEMMSRKQTIVEARKRNALQIKMQKDGLMRIMDEAKSNGARASKLIKDSVKSMNTPADSKKRSKSAGGGSGGRDKSLARSKSAEPEALGALGPQPEAPAHMSMKTSASQPPAQPYVSPYDLGETGGGGGAPAAKTVAF